MQRERNLPERVFDAVLDLLNIEKNVVLGIAAEAVLVSIWMLVAFIIAVALTVLYKL